MTPAVQDSQLPCGHCRKKAGWFCPSCLGAPDYEKDKPAKTSYCNAACQKADLESHRALCKGRRARKNLYRAGDTIKQVFNLYLEITWTRDVYKVERCKDECYQHEDGPIEMCNSLYLLNSPYLPFGFPTPFPAALLHSEQEKESALAHLNCHDCILSMHYMVESTLQEICSKIEEICVEPKNDRLKVIDVNSKGTRDLNYYRHEVFRVTTENGEMYALDLTGSQYGYYEPVIPWSSYEDLRVRMINKVLAFGDTQVNEGLAQKTTSRWQELLERFISCSTACMNMGLLQWEAENMAFNILIRLPDQEFIQKRNGLYAHIGAVLERLVPETYKRIAQGG